RAQIEEEDQKAMILEYLVGIDLRRQLGRSITCARSSPPVTCASFSKSSRLKPEMVCSTPSSKTRKSDCFRSVTALPDLSYTCTSTSTSLVCERRMKACCGLLEVGGEGFCWAGKAVGR